MSEKYVNFIGMYDNIFPDGFCDHLIVTFEKLVERGLCYSRKQSESTRKVVKDDFAFSLDINSHSELGTFNGESVSSIVIDTLQNCFDSYIDNYDILKESRLNCSSFKFQKTPPGGGYHIWHAEQNEGSMSSRCLFYIMYLNDIQDSGETEFIYQKIRIPSKKNTCIISPASFTHAHRGNPVFGEESKYVITGWFYFS